MPGTPNKTDAIKLNTTSTATIRFFDAGGNPTDPPAGATASYRYMDQFFNADRNDGKLQITPAGDGLGAAIKGVALGAQNIQVDIAGLRRI